MYCTSPFDKHVQISDRCLVRTGKTYTVNANKKKRVEGCVKMFFNLILQGEPLRNSKYKLAMTALVKDFSQHLAFVTKNCISELSSTNKLRSAEKAFKYSTSFEAVSCSPAAGYSQYSSVLECV